MTVKSLFMPFPARAWRTVVPEALRWLLVLCLGAEADAEVVWIAVESCSVLG